MSTIKVGDDFMTILPAPAGIKGVYKTVDAKNLPAYFIGDVFSILVCLPDVEAMQLNGDDTTANYPMRLQGEVGLAIIYPDASVSSPTRTYVSLEQWALYEGNGMAHVDHLWGEEIRLHRTTVELI